MTSTTNYRYNPDRRWMDASPQWVDPTPDPVGWPGRTVDPERWPPVAELGQTDDGWWY